MLGVEGSFRGVGAAAAPTSVCPSAPPCSPCICGSECGAGYCLKDLAEFPVLLDGRGEAGEGQGLRACWGKGQPVVSEPRLGSSSSPLLSSFLLPHGKVGWVMGEQHMECGSCGFALVGEQPSPGLEGRRQTDWSGSKCC